MRTGLWWVLGLSLVFFLGAAAFFGYYFTFGGGASQVAPANITIATSHTIHADNEKRRYQMVKNNVPPENANRPAEKMVCLLNMSGVYT